MISVESVECRALQLIDRALSARDPDHYRLVFLEWATALELLLSDEGGTQGRLSRV